MNIINEALPFEDCTDYVAEWPERCRRLRGAGCDG